MTENDGRDIGMIYPKDTLIMRNHVGDAKGADGEIVFEMSTNTFSGTPLIRHLKSGKYFSIDWQNMIDLAVAAGIDKEDENAV